MTTRELVIAGILVPVVAGVILLKIEYSFFTSGNSDLKSEATQVVEKIEGRKAEQSVKSFVEPDIAELQTLLEVAEKVYGTSSRNTEFARLVRLALNENKPGFALLVAKKAYGTSARNEQFVAILNKCIELKRFDLALEAAGFLYGTSARNEAFTKIIDAGLKLRPRTSNLLLQSTPASGRG